MPSPPTDGKLSWPQRGFLALLVVAGISLLGWSLVRYVWKPAVVGPTTIDLAQEVKDYLQSRDVRPLSEPLQKILADESFTPQKTQAHPLLDQPAAEIELVDAGGKVWKLSDARQRGPVVLVFYYGYHCNHCVGQLFALNNDLALIKEMGATVLAVSADPPELTRERFKKYGAFAFPVVADPGNVVAAKYGVFNPAKGKDGELLHGTFIIDRAGLVRWANLADEPFTDNRSLLRILASLK